MAATRREKLESMLESDPDDPFLHYTLAMEVRKSGDDEDARSRLAGMTTRFPDYVPTWFLLGQWQAEADLKAEAKQTITEGIAVARRMNDDHAAMEMTEYLGMID